MEETKSTSRTCVVVQISEKKDIGAVLSTIRNGLYGSWKSMMLIMCLDEGGCIDGSTELPHRRSDDSEVGLLDGSSNGWLLGIRLGMLPGTSDGFTDGCRDDALLGIRLGLSIGIIDGWFYYCSYNTSHY